VVATGHLLLTAVGSGLWPGIVQIAGDEGVGANECTGDTVERLLEVIRRGDSLSERDGLVAEFGLGVEENGLVD